VTILVINAGSSSMKFGLFDFDSLHCVATGMLDWGGGAGHAVVTLQPQGGDATREEIVVPDYRAGVVKALEMLRHSDALAGRAAGIRVVGHRLIHGGEEIRTPVHVDAEMKQTILRYAHLAPLHIPPGLEAIEATEAALPGVPQIGLFDTAFFARIPPCAYLYPVPYQWYEDWGIRRFGFHGTSHAYCTDRAAEMLARDKADLRLITCHLGQGSSATAVRGGVAVTNTMGFTPLEGFMMGTRSGTVDPGILIHVQRAHGLSVDQLDEILHKKSGLLGVSGLSSDFRQVEAAAADGHPRARLALDIYAYRVRAMIGSLAVTLGAVDALVFTGGIGENSIWLRREVSRGLELIGLDLDPDLNAQSSPDADAATADSPARILLIHTREALMIAREARRLVSSTQQGTGDREQGTGVEK
jgi:acetate kinase